MKHTGRQNNPPLVLLGVTGSIAAYKAVELLRLMIKTGYDVNVIMTAAAVRFVGELTFRTLSRNPVTVDQFERPELWQPGHVSLAEKAGLMVIAPCTANVLAKIALGLSDDMLGATALATMAPLVVAPAMNNNMWQHPATQGHLRLLRDRGAEIVEPENGELACGSEGSGRMREPKVIMETIKRMLPGTP